MSGFGGGFLDGCRARRLLIPCAIACALQLRLGDARAKTVTAPGEPGESEVSTSQLPRCFDSSNIHYKDCMLQCASDMSPRYIRRMCFQQCVAGANDAFFRCLLKRSYPEGEEP